LALKINCWGREGRGGQIYFWSCYNPILDSSTGEKKTVLWFDRHNKNITIGKGMKLYIFIMKGHEKNFVEKIHFKTA
jgi:hypothetical protein